MAPETTSMVVTEANGVPGVPTLMNAGQTGAACPPVSPASALRETISTYDAESDELAAQHWKADFARYLDAFVRLIPDHTRPIVDAGCGSGRDVASLVERGYECVGVDLSSGMLRQAQTRVLDKRAHWLLADIQAIPLETASVGGVWTNAALLHLDHEGQLAALQEFRRLLLPGRPLFVSTLASCGVSLRRTTTGRRRWFWGTDHVFFSDRARSVGLDIVWAKTEAGFVRGEWVNVLAIAH